MNNSLPENTDASSTKQPSKKLLVFRGVILGLLIGASISIVPVCGIRRTLDSVTSEPAQVIFFAEWIVVSAITGGALLPKLVLGDPLLKNFADTPNPIVRLFKQLILPVAAIIFLLLYFAASALCQRLDMGVIHANAATTQIFRYMGLLIATAGLVAQSLALVASNRKESEEYMRSPIFDLRHPCFFATLVTLTGVPMVMGTWYPLFAIPGIFIVMKWIVTEQERMLTEKYGPRYEEFQSRTRRLIPNLY